MVNDPVVCLLCVETSETTLVDLITSGGGRNRPTITRQTKRGLTVPESPPLYHIEHRRFHGNSQHGVSTHRPASSAVKA